VGAIFADAKQKHGQTIEKARDGETADFAAVAPERQFAVQTKLFVSLSLRFVSPRFASPSRLRGVWRRMPLLGALGLAPLAARTSPFTLRPTAACNGLDSVLINRLIN
jgi:hypothetical protein